MQYASYSNSKCRFVKVLKVIIKVIIKEREGDVEQKIFLLLKQRQRNITEWERKRKQCECRRRARVGPATGERTTHVPLRESAGEPATTPRCKLPPVWCSLYMRDRCRSILRRCVFPAGRLLLSNALFLALPCAPPKDVCTNGGVTCAVGVKGETSVSCVRTVDVGLRGVERRFSWPSR